MGNNVGSSKSRQRSARKDSRGINSRRKASLPAKSGKRKPPSKAGKVRPQVVVIQGVRFLGNPSRVEEIKRKAQVVRLDLTPLTGPIAKPLDQIKVDLTNANEGTIKVWREALQRHTQAA